VLELPGIAIDIDNAADLRQLISSAVETRTQRLAREWGLADRLTLAESG
jgi:2-phospho-L-lactate guanylyltransferase (CobY/MobA/RfbA family)